MIPLNIKVESIYVPDYFQDEDLFYMLKIYDIKKTNVENTVYHFSNVNHVKDFLHDGFYMYKLEFILQNIDTFLMESYNFNTYPYDDFLQQILSNFLQVSQMQDQKFKEHYINIYVKYFDGSADDFNIQHLNIAFNLIKQKCQDFSSKKSNKKLKV